MFIYVRQGFFFLCFLISWLLLLLLGESYLSYILLGGVSLFFLFFSGELEWQRVNHHKWLAILWLLSLFAMGLSLFFSISLPLSLYSMTRFIFASLVFWFFLLVKKSFISAQQIIKLLLLVSLVIMLISISFQLLPNLANLLPGMNLLHATYGHNHLAALLLLVIPLSWWLASDYVQAGQSWWWWFMPLVFNLGLLFSFGRVAVAVGLVQFLLVYWQLKKNNLIKSSQLKFLLKALVGLFSVILLSNIFFSTATLIKPDFACPVPKFRRQLCKSISTESRPQYWRWAVEVTKNNLWLGSGPGTFSLAAKKYYLDPFSGSAHAHNDFLESLAEMGVVGGGLFISLMFSLLCLAWKNLGKIKKWSWKMAAFFGVAAIYIDVLFDFDWEFISIFSITLMLLALIIKDQKTKLVKNNFSNFFKIIYSILVFSLLLVAGLYLKTDSLIKADHNQQAFQLFPYFHWHRKIYENSSTLDVKSKQRFYKIYKSQPAVYATWLTETKDKQQNQQIKEDWFEIDPWSTVSQDLISYYLDQGDLDQTKNWLQKEQDFYLRSQAQGHELDFKIKENNGQRALALAQAHLSQGDKTAALTLFEEIILNESSYQLPWKQEELIAQLLVETGNDFVSEDINQTIKAYELAKTNLPWILSSQELWFEKYPQLELSLKDLLKYLESAANWQYDYQQRLKLVKQVSLKTDELVRQEDYKLALQLAQAMSSVLPNDYWLVSQTARISIMTDNFDHAQQLYQECIDDWVASEFNDERHWECDTSLLQLTEVESNADKEQLIIDTKNRYFQVSQIIRGEAVWQDFK